MSPEARIASRTHRHRAAFSQRSSRYGASIRFAQAANPGVAPRQRSVSGLSNSGVSARRVARFLKSRVKGFASRGSDHDFPTFH